MSLLSDVVNQNPAITPAQKAEFKAMHPGGVGRYLEHVPLIVGAAMSPVALGAAGASAAAGGSDTSASPLDSSGPDPAALQSLYDTYLGPGGSASPDVTGASTGGGTGGVLKNILSY